MALGEPNPNLSKFRAVPAGKTITPLRGMSCTGTGMEIKLSGLILALRNSTLISAVVMVLPPGPGTPEAKTSTVSSQETAEKALLLISSMIPKGAVPLETVATI